MRLIDADDLDNVVSRLNEEGRATIRIEYKMLDNILFEFPTIDAEPVRRGQWIKRDGPCICSECGTWDYYAYIWNSETEKYTMQDLYCPHCGAKMEEQE